MNVELTATPPDGWDRFVESQPSCSAYHRAAAVQIARSAFGLPVYFLAARRNERIVGILPLVEQSSWAFGKFLVSVPFFTYGGVLASDSASAMALVRRATELARERGADHVELRHSEPAPALELPARLDKVSMVLPLPDSEAALGKQLGSKLRSQIKRAEREEPDVVWGGVELLPEFYSVFSRGMHELGTPVYPKKFFDVTCAALASLISVLVIRTHGKVAAAGIVLRHGRRLEVPWAAATPEAKRAAINMRMYWEMLAAATRWGMTSFDFGRSTVDSGTYRFKAQWGAQPVQLHWHYWLPQGRSIPQLNPHNPKYALATAAWKRMPLWCANFLGPYIVRNLP